MNTFYEVIDKHFTLHALFSKPDVFIYFLLTEFNFLAQIMDSVWNDFSLKKPPFLTLPARYSSSVLKLHATIDTYFSQYVKYEQEFNETAALLSRLMARRKNSFNKMKGFKDICKLNAALCRLLRVDFMRDLDSFRNTLPDVEYNEGTCTELPSRESFDFLLLRLIAVYELNKRIVDCCKSSAEYFTCQIRLYFFFEISTLLLAVLAKIHSMSIKFLNNAAEMYKNCLQYRIILPLNTKSRFLKGTQFEFPNSLEIIEQNFEQRETEIVKNRDLKDLLQQEEKLAPVKAKRLKKIDAGTQIKRVSKSPKSTFNIENLETVEEINGFIAQENKSRCTCVEKAVTAKILNHEWAGATKLFERKVQGGESVKAVTIFRKFLSLKIS